MGENKLSTVVDDNFDSEVLRTEKVVVVDFWAPWCEPCKLVEPILETLAERFGERVKMLVMNVDEARSKPAEYGVRSLPTLLIFKNGTIKNQLVGVHTEEKIEHAINSLL